MYQTLTRVKCANTSKYVQELFSATIGPLLDVFVIYNKLSQSKGMAVIHFKSPLDARRARERYNGKVIDGRKLSRHNENACMRN
jgi:RNA recognition motif-containing protein